MEKLFGRRQRRHSLEAPPAMASGDEPNHRLRHQSEAGSRSSATSPVPSMDEEKVDELEALADSVTTQASTPPAAPADGKRRSSVLGLRLALNLEPESPSRSRASSATNSPSSATAASVGAGSSASHDSGPTADRADCLAMDEVWYRCVKSSQVREGFAYNSRSLGHVQPGESLKALETRLNAQNQTRVRFECMRDGTRFRGWTSVQNKERKALLERIGFADFCYICLKRAAVRSGFQMTSDARGYIEEGEIVRIHEARMTDGGVERLHCDKGWVSAVSNGGATLLRPLLAVESEQAERRDAGRESFSKPQTKGILMRKVVTGTEADEDVDLPKLSAQVAKWDFTCKLISMERFRESEKHSVYILEMGDGQNTWRIHRSLAQLETLHEKLERRLGTERLKAMVDELPGEKKKLICRNRQDIDERKRAVESYLQHALVQPRIVSTSELLIFLYQAEHQNVGCAGQGMAAFKCPNRPLVIRGLRYRDERNPEFSLCADCMTQFRRANSSSTRSFQVLPATAPFTPTSLAELEKMAEDHAVEMTKRASMSKLGRGGAVAERRRLRTMSRAGDMVSGMGRPAVSNSGEILFDRFESPHGLLVPSAGGTGSLAPAARGSRRTSAPALDPKLEALAERFDTQFDSGKGLETMRTVCDDDEALAGFQLVQPGRKLVHTGWGTMFKAGVGGEIASVSVLPDLFLVICSDIIVRCMCSSKQPPTSEAELDGVKLRIVDVLKISEIDSVESYPSTAVCGRFLSDMIALRVEVVDPITRQQKNLSQLGRTMSRDKRSVRHELVDRAVACLQENEKIPSNTSFRKSKEQLREFMVAKGLTHLEIDEAERHADRAVSDSVPLSPLKESGKDAKDSGNDPFCWWGLCPRSPDAADEWAVALHGLVAHDSSVGVTLRSQLNDSTIHDGLLDHIEEAQKFSVLEIMNESGTTKTAEVTVSLCREEGLLIHENEAAGMLRAVVRWDTVSTWETSNSSTVFRLYLHMDSNTKAMARGGAALLHGKEMEGIFFRTDQAEKICRAIDKLASEKLGIAAPSNQRDRAATEALDTGRPRSSSAASEGIADVVGPPLSVDELKVALQAYYEQHSIDSSAVDFDQLSKDYRSPADQKNLDAALLKKHGQPLIAAVGLGRAATSGSSVHGLQVPSVDTLMLQMLRAEEWPQRVDEIDEIVQYVAHVQMGDRILVIPVDSSAGPTAFPLEAGSSSDSDEENQDVVVRDGKFSPLRQQTNDAADSPAVVRQASSRSVSRLDLGNRVESPADRGTEPTTRWSGEEIELHVLRRVEGSPPVRIGSTRVGLAEFTSADAPACVRWVPMWHSDAGAGMLHLTSLFVTSKTASELIAEGISCAEEWFSNEDTPTRDPLGFLVTKQPALWRHSFQRSQAIDKLQQGSWQAECTAQESRLHNLVYQGLPMELRGRFWVVMSMGVNLKRLAGAVYYDQMVLNFSDADAQIDLKGVRSCVHDALDKVNSHVRVTSSADGMRRNTEAHELSDLSVTRVVGAWCVHSGGDGTDCNEWAKLQNMEAVVAVVQVLMVGLIDQPDEFLIDEDDAFFTLMAISANGFFALDSAQVGAGLAETASVLKLVNPELHDHLVLQLGLGFTNSAALRRIYQSLLSLTLRTETLLRVWDLLFIRGRIVLHRALAVWLGGPLRAQLLAAADAAAVDAVMDVRSFEFMESDVFIQRVRTVPNLEAEAAEAEEEPTRPLVLSLELPTSLRHGDEQTPLPTMFAQFPASQKPPPISKEEFEALRANAESQRLDMPGPWNVDGTPKRGAAALRLLLQSDAPPAGFIGEDSGGLSGRDLSELGIARLLDFEEADTALSAISELQRKHLYLARVSGAIREARIKALQRMRAQVREVEYAQKLTSDAEASIKLFAQREEQAAKRKADAQHQTKELTEQLVNLKASLSEAQQREAEEKQSEAPLAPVAPV